MTIQRLFDQSPRSSHIFTIPADGPILISLFRPPPVPTPCYPSFLNVRILLVALPIYCTYLTGIYPGWWGELTPNLQLGSWRKRGLGWSKEETKVPPGGPPTPLPGGLQGAYFVFSDTEKWQISQNTYVKYTHMYKQNVYLYADVCIFISMQCVFIYMCVRVLIHYTKPHHIHIALCKTISLSYQYHHSDPV